MRIWGAIIAFSLACGGSPPPSEAERSAPPIHRSEEDRAAVIEVRSILVAFVGAEGADEAVTRTQAQAQARAETIASLVRQPDSNFGEVARTYSDAGIATQRIERGTADVPGAVQREAFRLRVGETSAPVLTPAGYLVLERRPDPQVGPAEIGARHILISHADAQRAPDDITRTREEARARAAEVAERVQGGESWDALHAEYSDERGGPGGGDLGTFGRGRMVPAFERAAFGLEVGEISDPVESPFGFHVIQRTE